MDRWLVGFRSLPGQDRPWWVRLLRLREGYHHAWCCRRLMPGWWLWCEWTPGKLLVGVVGADLVRRAVAAADEVLIYRAAAGAPRRVSLPQPAFLHCVVLVAQLVGLRLWWPTPWALACALRARGARTLLRSRGAT
jgi:hypothetical protein